MKAKKPFSRFVEKTSAKGAIGVFGAAGIFLTVFVIWSVTCFGGVLVDLARKHL